MKTHDFYFDLPQELIAQTPLERRDGSRLLVLDKKTGAVEHRHFYDLPEYLRPGDCLILNNSRVLPARLLGHRVPGGGACEVLLLIDRGNKTWECLVRPGKRMRTGAKLSFGDGELTAEVPVLAAEAGSAGNVAAGSVVVMAVAPAGVASCTNPEPCTGGADREGDEGLRARVMDSFRRLPNGANAAFYEQGALSFDQVAAASVLPRSRGRGTVDVVAATLEGMPDEELLGQLTDYFQQRREIAVDVLVRAPEAVTVDVAVKIDGGADQAGAAERVKTALRQWFTGERLGQDVLRARLGSLIFGCEGVKNYELTAPPEDLSLEPDQLPVLGTLTVEAMQ